MNAMDRSQTGFGRCIAAVARQLLGEPTARSTKDILYFGSRNGSLEVDIRKGVWHDHTLEIGGGTLDLVQHVLRIDKAGAVAWLEANRHIEPATVNRKIVATYDYRSETGELLYQVCRYEPKDFRQRRPDGNGGWQWKTKGVARVPYRLPELTTADPSKPVFIVEGERKADALIALGFIATCNTGGAAAPGQNSKWPREFAKYFVDRDVMILPDRDDPGEAHALAIANSLTDERMAAKSVRIVRLPDLPPKGDIVDWLASGGTSDLLRRLAELTPLFEKQDFDHVQKTEAEVPFEAIRHSGKVIRVVTGEMHLTATAAENAIISSGLAVFQRGPDLVRPVSREVSASHSRTTIAASLGTLSSHSMLDIFCGVAEWQRYDGRNKDWARTNPPMDVVKILLSREGFWSLPTIAGVITSPTIRPDGSVLSDAGYDSATRLYHFKDPMLTLSPCIQKPTKKDAIEALGLLEALLDEFPFAEGGTQSPEVSKAVALSGLITPLVRGALSVAPLHAYCANTAGSGKSYLVDLASVISTGRPCPVISVAIGDDRETDKRIAGALLAGMPIVSIDNCNGELGSDLLAQAIERPFIKLRRLGGSEMFEIESRSTMFGTGNGLRVRGDMVRRTIKSDLDPGVERPELREFEKSPVQMVLADRGRYVSAVLTVVRAYALAGYPDVVPAIGSYDDWSRVVRSPLVWLGCADPADSMEAAREDDPELSELREILTLWVEAFKDETITLRRVVERIEEHLPSKMGEPTDVAYPDLRDALFRLAGERGVINTKRLGKWLSSHAGRLVGQRRFKHAGNARGGVAQWRVEIR